MIRSNRRENMGERRMNEGRTISFTLGGLAFEYDEQKNQINIKKHGISFKSAARIFFDYNRIELCDDEHSEGEIRYDTIGDTSSTMVSYRISPSLCSSSHNSIRL